MKKRYILLFVIIIFVGFLAGYRFGYKVSPREFITEDTKIIYANEGIADKDFKEIMPLMQLEKKQIMKNLKKLKNIFQKYMLFLILIFIIEN